MTSFKHLFDTVRTQPEQAGRWAIDLLFWGLLTAATLAVIYPLWIGPMPPLTDFGGHASIADVWARYDEVELYRELFVLNDGLMPNTLPSRFARLLYPLVEPLASLRLFTSLMMAATIGALVWMAHVFDRSRWLVFLCVPFLWNTGLHWGMVNYVAVIPFFFAALAAARKTGQTGDWRWSIALGLICVASFFAHGLGCVFAIGAAAFVLFFSVERLRDLLYLLAFMPATALWIIWKKSMSGADGMPSGGILDLLEHHARWQTPVEQVKYFLAHAINATSTEDEIILFFVLMGVWILWMGVSTGAEEDASSDERLWPGWPPRLPNLRRLVLRFYDEAKRHTLLLVVICLGIAVAIFPAYIHRTNIATRVVPLFVMCAALLPRLPRRSWIAAAGGAVAIAAPFWFGHYLDENIERFARTELDPIAELVEHIPNQSKVECMQLRGYNQTLMHGSAVNHNCPGLVQMRTQSFGGFHFPATGFNAITFRPGFEYADTHNDGFDNLALIQAWDFIITDRKHDLPERDVVSLVDTAKADDEDAPTWHLYRVYDFELRAVHSDEAGGKGGHVFSWYCPTGQALTQLDGRLGSKDKNFGQLRPRCREAKPRGNALRHGKITSGPYFATRGEEKSRARLSCPRDTFVVGLHGRADNLVGQLGLICARIEQTGAEDGAWKEKDVEKTKAKGEGDGERFELRCPEGSVAQGLRGRAGSAIDAVGIECVEIGQLDEPFRD